MNQNDGVRDAILRTLYDTSANARSVKKTAIGIKDLNAKLRPLGVKQQQVAHNLAYLIDKGWVREDILTRTFTTPRGTTQNSEQVKYRISDTGIDKLENASLFADTPAARSVAGINITTINGVTVLGDDNVVNTRFTELTHVLTELRTAILEGPGLTETDRLNAVTDLDSIRGQLQKPEPDAHLIKRLWANVERAATLGGAVELADRAREALAPLIG